MNPNDSSPKPAAPELYESPFARTHKDAGTLPPGARADDDQADDWADDERGPPAERSQVAPMLPTLAPVINAAIYAAIGYYLGRSPLLFGAVGGAVALAATSSAISETIGQDAAPLAVATRWASSPGDLIAGLIGA